MGATVSHCEVETNTPALAGEHVANKGEERIEYYSKGGGEEPAGDDESAEEEEAEETRPAVQVATMPYDPRFPGVNQARTCYTRYNEFYKCKEQKDETDPECVRHQKAYRALCPGEWVESWNEARQAGTWYGKY